MIIVIVKFETTLSEDEVMAIAREREPEFRALPGLLQKYYFKTDTPGEYGGVYVWDSPASLQAYRASDLAASIPAAYKVVEAPSIQVLHTLFQLRE